MEEHIKGSISPIVFLSISFFFNQKLAVVVFSENINWILFIFFYYQQQITQLSSTY